MEITKGELYFNYDGRWVKIMDVQGIEVSRPEALQFAADTKHITDSFSFTATSTLDSVNIPHQDRLNEIGDWLKQNKAKSIRLEDGKYIVTYHDGTEWAYDIKEVEEQDEKFFVGGDSDTLAKLVENNRKKVRWEEEYDVEWGE